MELDKMKLNKIIKKYIEKIQEIENEKKFLSEMTNDIINELTIKYSQREIAKFLKIPEQLISMMKAGRRKFTLKQIEIIKNQIS